MQGKGYYPQIHFAAKYGWINDPNGLVYHDGIYELYFQYNPEGIQWGNMTWGHARSRDLLHWEEMKPVLYPDENGFMYSGCGIKNDKGLLSLPKDALIFYYTAALHNWTDASKTKFTIRRAYSLDGGKTLVKEGKPVLQALYPDNRDPKVFWHEESGAYILVLWLHGEEFGIFRSSDMEYFELSQRIKLEGGYECPDLFKLPVYDEKTQKRTGSKWVFMAADSSYYIGSFDGFTFTKECERQKANTINSLPYAAQTFSGTDEVISMAWLCTKCIGLSTTGVISLPRTLSLVKRESGYQLIQKLPESVKHNFKTVKMLQHIGEAAVVEEDAALWLQVHCENSWTLELYSENEEKEVVLSYESSSGNFMITHQNVSTFVLPGGTAENWDVVYDKGIFEISSKDGIMLNITDIPELRMQAVRKILLKEGECQVMVMDIL